MFRTLLICSICCSNSTLFFSNDPATTEIYTLSLHDALPISTSSRRSRTPSATWSPGARWIGWSRSEEHTSELQSLRHLVCRLLLEKKKKKKKHKRLQRNKHQTNVYTRHDAMDEKHRLTLDAD